MAVVGSLANATLIDVGQTLTIQNGGTLDAPNAQVVTGVDMTFGAGCTAMIGGSAAAPHTASRNMSISGSVTFASGAELLLNGTSSQFLNGSFPLPPVRFTGTFLQSGTNPPLTIESFTQTGTGTTTFGNLTVLGDAVFTGPLGGNGGTLDVDGDITITGATPTQFPPNIRIAGDWTSDSSFQPVVGFVEFDGAGSQSILATAPQFHMLTVQA
ncbi:MAG: hypothetical protein AAF479_15305, partial [Pseudomonadota bacterium]